MLITLSAFLRPIYPIIPFPATLRGFCSVVLVSNNPTKPYNNMTFGNKICLM